MRNSTLDSNVDLIDTTNPEITIRKPDKKKSFWKLTALFKTFALRERNHATAKNSFGSTVCEVTEWARSLQHLLSSKSGIMALRLFMKSEHCEENIEFWLACEEYQTIRSRSKLLSKAKQIYDEFVMEDSPKEINLEYHMREQINHNLQTPTKSCFSEAQNRIYFLMEYNSYPRFIQSEVYRRLCKTLAEH